MGDGIEVVSDLGNALAEPTLRKALLDLCPDLVFDPAGKLGYFHPNLARWQGMWHNERHVGSMDRGPMIPEFDRWQLAVLKDGTRYRHKIYNIGWRTTIQTLINREVPGITWDRVCRKLKVEMKVYTGKPDELEFQWWQVPA